MTIACKNKDTLFFWFSLRRCLIDITSIGGLVLKKQHFFKSSYFFLMYGQISKVRHPSAFLLTWVDGWGSQQVDDNLMFLFSRWSRMRKFYWIIKKPSWACSRFSTQLFECHLWMQSTALLTPRRVSGSIWGTIIIIFAVKAHTDSIAR